MPASASRSETLVTTPLTDSSSDTGWTVTPALAKASSAYLPAGTSGAASTTLRSSAARSASPVMCLGLPGSTAIISLLPAKSCGAPVLPAILSMLLPSAVASTSAGAPCCSCVTRSLLPAKANVTFTSGWAAVNWSPSCVKASVSDAAAKTVSSR